MRTALLIAMREVKERRAVLVAALVAGLLAFAGPLVPGVGAERAGEARDVLAAIFAFGFGMILAVLLGATAVARDLAENRLGFDFARPIGGLAIWSGRIGAAVGLTLAAMIVVAAPAMLVGGHLWPLSTSSGDPVWQVCAKILASVLFLVALAHVASVAIRSRSRWLALDLVGLVVALLLTASGVRRISGAFAVQTSQVVTDVAVLLTIPALWIASAVQVTRGRTDIVVGHRVQSVALWSMLLVVATVVFGYSLWFLAWDIDDLHFVSARAAPQGPWIELTGISHGRPGLEGQYLLDPESGRTVRLGPSRYHTTHFSRDGRRAVRLHYDRTAGPTVNVFLIDLDVPEPQIRETSIAFNLESAIWTELSPSGARLLTLKGKQIAVHDLESGRILAATTLESSAKEWSQKKITFLDENRVRVYTLDDRLVAYEFDIDTRVMTTWTGGALGEEHSPLAWNRDHSRLILSNHQGLGVLLLDASSGATIATLAPPDAEPKPRCDFLHDGRIVRLAGSSAGRVSLDLLTADGEPIDSFDLGEVASNEKLWLGAEAAPGTLLVERSALRVPGKVDERRLLLVDLASGAIRDVEGVGRPASVMSWFWQKTLPAQPGSVAARLVHSNGSVWLLEVESATLRHVVGRAK